MSRKKWCFMCVCAGCVPAAWRCLRGWQLDCWPWMMLLLPYDSWMAVGFWNEPVQLGTSRVFREKTATPVSVRWTVLLSFSLLSFSFFFLFFFVFLWKKFWANITYTVLVHTYCVHCTYLHKLPSFCIPDFYNNVACYCLVKIGVSSVWQNVIFSKRFLQ